MGAMIAIAIACFFITGTVASSRAGTMLHCDVGLGPPIGIVGRTCVYSPVGGTAWRFHWRWFPNADARAILRKAGPRYVARFDRALAVHDATWRIGSFVTVALLLLANVLIRRASKTKSVLHGASRWATLDDLIRAGLIPTIKPPLPVRVWNRARWAAAVIGAFVRHVTTGAFAKRGAQR